AAAGAVRSQQRPDCVRVPAVVDRASMPLALGGLPAILVAQRGVRTPSARAPARHHLAAWWRKVMSDGSEQAIDDEELRAILLHNAAEELEHAAMALEWLRRNDPQVDENLREYLFKDGSITGHEEQATGKA
ncbi:MAG TPA: hypothetical protein PLO65_08700, partial [Caulobacter sp.]|nr:hypothetical protein [Caulobacter sp.]